MENSISSVRQSHPHPYFRITSAAIHIPVPPSAVESPRLYLPRCHRWLIVQKAMANVPDTQVSVGFFADRYPCMIFCPFSRRLFITERKSRCTRLSASNTQNASYPLFNAKIWGNAQSMAYPFPTSSLLKRTRTFAP